MSLRRFSSLRTAFLAACFAGCSLGDDAADSQLTNSDPVVESLRAREIVDEAHGRFIVRPPELPALLAEELAAETDLTPKAFLQPSEVLSFAKDEQELIPSFASTLPSTAAVRIHERLADGFHVARKDAKLAIGVRLAGATPAVAEVGDGFVVFHDGLGPGTEVIERPSPDGLEDFVRFQAQPQNEELIYELEFDRRVSGLRVVDNTLEMLDADGTPRLRVPPPAVVDGAGRWHWASLTVEGCAVDTNPVPPWGRATTAPGASRCELHIDWSSRGVVYPALVDPNMWTNTNAMATARFSHIDARISGGKVLVAGGFNSSLAIISSAEIWDPSSGTWSTTGSMSNSRVYAAATATSAAATTILVAGGIGSGCSGAPCNLVELYSVSGGSWSSTGSMGTGRSSFGLSLLSSGTDILASGGVDGSSTVTATAELYSISGGTWSGTGSMATARYDHSSTALAGSVAAVATFGRNATITLNTAEKWSGGAWSSAGTAYASISRGKHTATLLSGDAILVAGGVAGVTSGGPCLNRPMIWTSPTTWNTAGTMTGGNRCFHTATLLTDGTVLVTGGASTVGGTALDSVSLFNPSTTSWSALAVMGTARASHSATLYDTSTPNKVLVAGGINGGGALSSAQYFTH